MRHALQTERRYRTGKSHLILLVKRLRGLSANWRQKKYDLVVEKEGILARVQVKYGGLYKGLQKCHVALRVMGGNQSYHSAKKYIKEDFDYLFVYTAKKHSYFLPWNDDVIGKSVISIETSKYSSFRVDVQG